MQTSVPTNGAAHGAPAASTPEQPQRSTLTIDRAELRWRLSIADERQRGLEALLKLRASGQRKTTDLRHGLWWGANALEEVVADRVDSIRRSGGLLHVGVRGALL